MVLADVTAITKCLIWGLPSEPVHSNGESVEPAWPRQRLDGPRWLKMEKIMSKTSYSAAATSDHELTEAELDVVAGGNWAWGAVIALAILDTATDGASSQPLAQWALNGGRS
jgi:hypothetical protein